MCLRYIADNALTIRPIGATDNGTNPLFNDTGTRTISLCTKNYLEVGRAWDVEVGDEAMYVGEDAVPLLGDAVHADHGNDLFRRLLLGRLASSWINLHGLARGGV